METETNTSHHAKPNWLIDGIPSDQAADVWPSIWPTLKKAVDRAPEEIRMTKDQLFTEWSEGKRQVWVIVHIPKQELAAVVMTSVIDAGKWFPDSLALEVPFVAGKGMKHWLEALHKLLNSYGQHMGAQYMVGYGRKGWERMVKFKHIGYTDGGIRIMVRPIERLH